MQLVYLIDSLGSGGAQRQAVELAVFLKRRHAVDVRFLVYHALDFHAPRLRDAGIPVDVLSKSGTYDVAFPWRLSRRIARTKPDLIHAFLLHPVAWGTAAIRLVPPAHRPLFVAGERSGRVATSPSLRAMQTACYRLADAVTANAAPVARQIHERLGVPSARVHYLPNGIDLAQWDALSGVPSPFTFEPGHFHVGLVGGLRAEKNHALLLEALSHVPESILARWRVWFIGGATGTPGQADAIRAAVERRGLGAVVRFEGETPAIAAVLRQLDALVLPSAFEGFPNILLEAMASGLPGVATAVGNVAEMLEDGLSGFLVPPEDAVAMAAGLMRLAALSPEERRRMGEAARASVEARYRMESVGAAHLALYRSLLASNAPRG